MERHGDGLAWIRAERRAAPVALEEEAPPPRPRGGPRRRAAAAEAAPAAASTLRLPRTPAEARELLGVPAGASRKEVDAAFRRASRKCHPDLVAHLDEEFQRLAHDKFLRIKRAQELLSPPRGPGGRAT
jgi:hypothetical protein